MNNLLVEKTKNVDWEFLTDDTRYDTHDFHRYSSKFIPQIARNLIEIYSKKGELVLDVFVGSGTTCVEAELLGRNSIGNDLNPLAYLITKVKTTSIKDEVLDTDVANILSDIRNKVAENREFENPSQTLFAHKAKKIKADAPSFPNIERWFQPQVLRELSIIKDAINNIKSVELKQFFVCAFSATLRGVSNAHSGYGNLMINKNKRLVKDTLESFERQILTMVEGMKSFNKHVEKVSSKIYCSDSRDLSFVKNNSVDLIVTHPPYISAVPYAEYQKLSLNWLKECFSDVFNDNCKEYLNPRILDKEIIGGQRGNKNVVSRFMESMKLIFQEMYRVLKDQRYCCIVIGHPTVQGKIIELSGEFLQMANEVGFKHFYTVTRGSHRTTMGKMKEEYILIFQKS
ncbi:MAG: DNA adenine methylase [Candidatus Woesebacteria bacterium]|nr:MAG: DNA adenine methylase [Candidatus Woesebacteria bacterium]